MSILASSHNLRHPSPIISFSRSMRCNRHQHLLYPSVNKGASSWYFSVVPHILQRFILYWINPRYVLASENTHRLSSLSSDLQLQTSQIRAAISQRESLQPISVSPTPLASNRNIAGDIRVIGRNIMFFLLKIYKQGVVCFRISNFCCKFAIGLPIAVIHQRIAIL